MKNTKTNLLRTVATGMAAGSAFLAATWLDSRLSRYPFNDVKLVGQMLTTRSPMWQLQGLAGHYGFSIVMTLLYGRVFYSRLPGPPVLRGITFLQIENLALYPLVYLLDSFHAGMRAGEVPSMGNMKIFMGQALRHVAFAAVLGAMYRGGRKD